MGNLAIVPAWVAPPTSDIGGCHQFAAHYADRSRFARACAATFEWVVGGDDPDLVTPVSGRWLAPTEQASRAEMMLAAAVATGQDGLSADIWSALEVPPAVAVLRGQDWVNAAAATLGWLLGVHSRPPLHWH